MAGNTEILLCNCERSDVVSASVKRQVLSALERSGAGFTLVSDLCAMAAKYDPALRRIASAPDVRIAACFPRAVRGLFAAAGVDLPDSGVTFANMREQTAEGVTDALLAGGGQAGTTGRRKIEQADDWIAWFPVIDRQRCTNCKTCLSFCLFGVYGMSAGGRVEVRNPANCKTNCPACARVCPQTAIIFPKHPDGPINGDEVRPEDARKAGVGADIQSLASGDVLAKLRARSAELQKLKDDLGIPQEVLDSVLPGGIATDQCDCTGDSDCDRASDCDCDCGSSSRGKACGNCDQ